MDENEIKEKVRGIWPEVIGAVVTNRNGVVNLSPVNYQAVPTRHELPLCLCVGMANTSRMLADSLETGEFVYSYPAIEQLQHILYCGTVSGTDRNKIADTPLQFTRCNDFSVPILQDAVLNYQCKVTHHYDAGYFTIVVGTIQNIIPGARDPLDKVYALGDGRYGRLGSIEVLQEGRLSARYQHITQG